MLEGLWCILWALLWGVYFALDGFVLGMGTLLPFIAKSDAEKRVIYNAAGPYWDANEVWLITAGGVTFAAFPKAYAVMFSALYAPLLILLFALIFRAVSFEFRNKQIDYDWKARCDRCQFWGNFIPALLLGVAFANLFKGIPIDASGVYHGNIFRLLNLYGLAGGIFFVMFFCMHGALWLTLKADGTVKDRAAGIARKLWLPLAGMAGFFLLLTAFFTDLYANYLAHPLLFLFPLLAVIALLVLRVMIAAEYWIGSWVCSAVFIIAVTFFGVIGMFPGLILSSLDPAYSITIMNGASSPFTLKIMLAVVIIFLPIVLAYQAWTYRLFAHRVNPESISKDDHAY